MLVFTYTVSIYMLYMSKLKAARRSFNSLIARMHPREGMSSIVGWGSGSAMDNYRIEPFIE